MSTGLDGVHTANFSQINYKSQKAAGFFLPKKKKGKKHYAVMHALLWGWKMTRLTTACTPCRPFQSCTLCVPSTPNHAVLRKKAQFLLRRDSSLDITNCSETLDQGY